MNFVEAQDKYSKSVPPEHVNMTESHHSRLTFAHFVSCAPVQLNPTKGSTMDPLPQISQSGGRVPAPPQRGHKTANYVDSGVNTPTLISTLPPASNTNTTAHHPNAGNKHLKTASNYSLKWSNNAFYIYISDYSAQSLASDFGFEDNFNHTLKVEEKKNHQNRIVASRDPPPVPPLPPRKASFTPTYQLPPAPLPKERAVSSQAKDNSAGITRPEWDTAHL